MIKLLLAGILAASLLAAVRPGIDSGTCLDQYAACLQSGTPHDACKAALFVCKAAKR